MTKYVEELFGLDGRVAVVVGGGGHVCGAMAHGLAKAGCAVAVVDLREEKAVAAAEEIEKESGQRAIGVQCNAAVKEDVEAALSKIVATLGPVDILINGAGINSPTPIFDITVDEWDEVMASQLTATMLGCQIFGKHMVERKKGSIINISSASAGPPLSKVFPYSAAKAAIKNLTQNLGREWATDGVRVNAIRPGFFPTEWNRKNFISAEREASILGHTPMGRFGDVSELIGATVWLASDAAGFVTGAEIAVDGGFSCMTI